MKARKPKLEGMKVRLLGKGYAAAFALVTALFFLWGFARSFLDVLNRHFQETLSVGIAGGTLVQASTYIAYALAAVPAGICITRRGYRFSLVAGLLIFGAGALLFIPGSASGVFSVFLAALFVMGCGLAFLETSANPYISALGPEETGASRLNLAQAFNGFGCLLGPLAIGSYLFGSGGERDIAVPYAAMGGAVLVLAVLFAVIRLPKPESKGQGAMQGFAASSMRLWRQGWFRGGIAALFSYEIAEIGINSMFINYAVSTGWLSALEATAVLSLGGLGLFMAARIAGGAVMRRVPAKKVLAICAAVACVAAATVALGSGRGAHAALLICYGAEAVIFPTVFAITAGKAGADAPAASAYMMMTPLGGAVGAVAMGWTASWAGLTPAFIVPALGYAAVLAYALAQAREGEREKQ